MAQLEYLTKIMQVIEKIDKEQSENIQAAADLCAATIHSGKLVHLFGSGHSVLPVLDVFPRYGGVVAGFHTADSHRAAVYRGVVLHHAPADRRQ